MKTKAALHGECIIFQSSIPEDAKEINVKSYLIIGNSETTGNHHVVDSSEGVTFYELDGVRYMRNTGKASVRCLHEDRHDEIEIPVGTWEFGTQKEYDYFEQGLRNVAD